MNIDAHNYNQESVHIQLKDLVDKEKFNKLVSEVNYMNNVAIREDIKPFETTLSNKNILHLIHEADRVIRSNQDSTKEINIIYSIAKELFPNPKVKVDIHAPKHVMMTRRLSESEKAALMTERYGEGIKLTRSLDKNIFENRPPNPEKDYTPPIFSLNAQDTSKFIEENPPSINSCHILGGLKCGTVVHLYTANEQYDTVLNLINQYSTSIDPNIVDEEKKTILITACKAYAPSNVINSMLTASFHADMDINAKDSQGATALHYACLYGRVDLVKTLIKQGADPKSVDNNGKTPLDWAKKDDKFIKHQLETISIDGERDAHARKNNVKKVSLGFYSILMSQSNLDKMIKTIEKEGPDHYDYEHLPFLKEMRNQLLGKSLISFCQEGQKDVIAYLESQLS